MMGFFCVGCGLWCFAVFWRENLKQTKHQISQQAQLKAEKETAAKALAECEKLKAQVRPEEVEHISYRGPWSKLDDELIVLRRHACGRVFWGKSVSGKESSKCQWLFCMGIWGEIFISLRDKKTSNLPVFLCIPQLRRLMLRSRIHPGDHVKPGH